MSFFNTLRGNKKTQPKDSIDVPNCPECGLPMAYIVLIVEHGELPKPSKFWGCFNCERGSIDGL